ncbi:MAG: cyclic nucleotide-binding domain-containing protein [Chloroflexota bacterium]|jgi:CRP-like cAMP-binding protein
MLLTIEKVASLRKVAIFAATPDHVLASVAQIAYEETFEPGQAIMQEGDFGDFMYVVADGRVRVHKGDQTIITLETGATVGELAVLDPEPRSASVTAVTDTLLFRIDKEPFDEVMADRPEIAQGVIQALCGRIRAQSEVPARSAAEPSPAGA